MSGPNVLTIPPGVPFLGTLADGLFSGAVVPGFTPDPADPAALADVTLYLPTRRAARAFAALVAERCGGRPVLLPRIVPLGDVDATEFHLAAGIDDDPAGAHAGLAPSVPDLERRLLLANLILAWARRLPDAVRSPDGPAEEPLLVATTPGDALALAADLVRLMDDLCIQEIDWGALRGTVADRFDPYYAMTADFLAIAATYWPAILSERGAVDPAWRRDRIRRAEAERLARDGAPGPVIAAGSTGSVPSTALLLKAIAGARSGAVVLPGLDIAMDARTEAAILDGADGREPAHTHPQATLARLIRTIGIARGEVRVLGAASPRAQARERLVAEAARPAATTDAWSGSPMAADDLATGLAGIALVEAFDEREEALAAAIAIREALEDEGGTVALVTPDRTLAERVCAELKRWRIEAEDSAGLPLSRSPSGIFARLVADAAVADLEPAPLLALLNHRMARFGMEDDAIRRARAVLEIGAFRGPQPPPGMAGLRRALALGRKAREARHAPRPLKRLSPADFDLAEALLDRIEAAFAPLGGLSGRADLDLPALGGPHRETCAAAALPPGGAPETAGEDAEALAGLFDDLAAAGEGLLVGSLRDYAEMFGRLCAERIVRRGGGAGHRRVKIWGLLEARLLDADRIVLGGLVEGVWPPSATTDAFLNRPMRGALGLPLPELRIGQTAHDFAQALGNRDVVITMAGRRDGKPAIPSRFIERLRAYAGREAWGEVRRRGGRYLSLARQLGRPIPEPPLRRPSPTPPAALQPTSLSVTEIETLTRDTYAIHARHVLKLDPLPALAEPPGAADRGTLLHEAYAAFARQWDATPPARRLDVLLEIGRELFAAIADYPDIAALWWPRFVRQAPALVDWEAGRRAMRPRVEVEIGGRLPIVLADGTVFTLTARADRIETGDGTPAIVDFKTGQPPSVKQVRAGAAPQLTLQAAMLRRAGFGGVEPGVWPPELLYAKPGRSGLDETFIVPKDAYPFDPETLPEIHLARLTEMLDGLRAGTRGFTSRPWVEFARRYGDYDHLARVKEWSAFADEGEG